MIKGPAGGHPHSPGATHWRMKSSNGSEWVTKYCYYRSEVEAWDLSKPLWPVFK